MCVRVFFFVKKAARSLFYLFLVILGLYNLFLYIKKSLRKRKEKSDAPLISVFQGIKSWMLNKKGAVE